MPPLQNAYALVIGIAGYPYINPLPDAVRNDAHAISALLADEQYCAYPPPNVQCLLDQDATALAITEAMRNLAQRSNRDSYVLIYFSGHGGRLTAGPQAGEYLLPFDTKYFAESEPRLENVLSAADLTALLDAIPAQKLVVILDCCHAAGLTKDAQPVVTPVLPDVQEVSNSFYQTLQGGRARAVLAASRGDELSWIVDREHSLFTQELLTGLRGGVFSDDGFVRIFDLFNWVQKAVQAVRPDQHPLLKFVGEENIALALYKAGSTKDIDNDPDGYRYDVYLSYAPADEQWIYDVLAPKLEANQITFVTYEDFAGAPRVVSAEDGTKYARRTLVVLSSAYLSDNNAEWDSLLALYKGIDRGIWNLIPVKREPVDSAKLRTGLAMLIPVDLTNPLRFDQRMTQLMRTLKEPVRIWSSP